MADDKELCLDGLPGFAQRRVALGDYFRVLKSSR
jgi:hypothetical protein